ncbi:MAG: GNAT family N-acetyltransferase [bacterium]|nr:GNAT family N-acetyltransferase [bacterium]
MEIEVKKAKTENLQDCVKALDHSTLSTTYFPTEENRIYVVKEAIDSGNTYVVFYKGECVGFLYYMEQGAFHSFPYIHLIAIKEAYRGKGVGRKLLEFVEHKLFETRDKIFLVVGEYNPEGKNFYKNLGYMCVGTIPSLYREEVDENIMMKVSHKK